MCFEAKLSPLFSYSYSAIGGARTFTRSAFGSGIEYEYEYRFTEYEYDFDKFDAGNLREESCFLGF